MKTAYIRAPFQFDLREVTLPPLGDSEILVEVQACGVCGPDLDAAATTAAEWQPAGHEIAGVVKRTGTRVRNVNTGDKVVLESGTFDRYSAASRNGRVDLDNKGPNFWAKGPMGFSEFMIAPCETAVPFTRLSFTQAALIEPLGVAMDMVRTANIELGDDVLVIGTGTIGLMALRLARMRGARRIYAAQRSGADRRIELARAFGADEVILTDHTSLRDFPFARGGVDHVLVTAPPPSIEQAMATANTGGVITFIGIGHGGDEHIEFDANDFHFRKLQLRGSFASPALYFPLCIDLAEAGLIDLGTLISHTFPLERIADAFACMRDERATRVKVVVTPRAPSRNGSL